MDKADDGGVEEIVCHITFADIWRTDHSIKI